MDIRVTYQIGLQNPRKKRGQKNIFPFLPSLEEATAESVGTISEWAGSYHILAMGRHFRSYVEDHDYVEIRENNLFPYIEYYSSLREKTPASTVTGNIGQTLTALYATQFFDSGIQDIVILDPKTQFKARKTPDFLIKIKSFKEKFPSDPLIRKLASYPFWWPVECKARKEGESNIYEAKKEAFLQLLSFWMEIQKDFPSNVGYGIITIFINSDQPRLHLVLIIPKDLDALNLKIRELSQKKGAFKNKKDSEGKEMSKSLKEYSSISKLLGLHENLYGF